MGTPSLESVAQQIEQLSEKDQHLLLKHLSQKLSQQKKRSRRSDKELRDVLDKAWGAWDTGKSIEEIDREIKEMRKRDWSREWDRES